MDLLNNKEQNNFQTFSSGNTKVTFDDNGYIVEAINFMYVMWSEPNIDEQLIGKHILELAQMIKKDGSIGYVNFLENVVIKFYERKANNNITKDCRTCQNMSCKVDQDKKGKHLAKTTGDFKQ